MPVARSEVWGCQSVCHAGDQAIAIAAADAAAHVAPAQGAESEGRGHANETEGSAL